MKRLLTRILGVLLCAALVLPLLPPSAGALTLTAVNDTLLPVSEGTMPARLGGELYVPYDVFTQLGVSSSSEEGVLNLSSGGETLSFSPDEGYVYDQYMNSYDSPAYSMNGTVYVPVKLCCGKFGLTYSTFSAYGETVLRVTDGASQSDSEFASSASGDIERAINAYKGVPTSPDTPNNGGNTQKPSDKPVEPPIPPVEEKPTQKPGRVYLTFFGPTTQYTPQTLDALHGAGRLATFFLSTDTAAWSSDTVRRIVGEGHTAALLLYAEPSVAPDELVERLTAANKQLAFLTGVNTRIFSNADGCNKLTAAQRDAIIAAGYRLWDSTMDSGDSTQSAPMTYAVTAQRFAATNATVVLRLRHSASTASAVQSLSAYMLRQGIPSSRVTLNTSPINLISDIR
ncbi:polysaccharide deacetylase family protein [Butyricicoccus faecihominis]|uniref:polysaccharide deacetylase family protein n=1 Tax=Butyricicoccus faecihominis TaxID=1712515 RepID=UPI00247A9FE1|nr:polysaccharide deacetylase family protein [Butyricicoccus faecihominis]MCQ5128049.1 polysaccharide deacetylase family protein [Butyricicoccus faecihominis]